MSGVVGQSIRNLGAQVRATVLGPRLAAFLPAIMLGAYWFGGEGVLLTAAVVFPALIAAFGLIGQVGGNRTALDPVTGLPGRPQLASALTPAVGDFSGATGADRIALVLEIDRASDLARQHGTAGFEEILRSTGARLEGVLRNNDVVTSLGGGRFGIALAKTPRMTIETMTQLAARLQDAIAAPIRLGGMRVLVTACIGFALPSRVSENTAEGMIAAAESALIEAQHAGPGSIRAYSQGMRRRAGAPAKLTREVVQALESDQIRPWFQPQISTETGEISGFEALARWSHPEKGLIAPGAFLPAIESAGKHGRLGEVMLFHALSALREWERSGFVIPSVSVNVSPEELRDPGLVDRIRWELDRFDLSPERLTIEILESVVAQSDDDYTTKNISALSHLGCKIDLDDFGTGHASIANIRRFDVHRLKIDRSFITHVDTDREQQNLVSAILSMAERLNLETLGEGVESHGEHAMLAQLGCDHVQGYLIARPMPFAEATRWISARREKQVLLPPIINRHG